MPVICYIKIPTVKWTKWYNIMYFRKKLDTIDNAILLLDFFQ